MEPAEAVTRQERVGLLVFSAVLVAFGAFWAFEALKLPSHSAFVSISPGLLPTGAGIVMMLAGIALAAVYWRHPAVPDDPANPLFDIRGQLRVLAMLAILLGYILVIDRFHYALTTFVAMAAGLAVASEPLRWPLPLKAAAIAGFMFVVFILWLDVPLPGSRFG